MPVSNLTSANSTIYSCTVLGVTKLEYGYIKGLHEMMMLVTCIAAPPTAVANALVLIAIYRNRHLQNPANFLFCGLALTDLSVGLIIEPLYISSLTAAIQNNILKSCRLREFSYRFSFFFTCSSLIIVTFISVERWLIIHLKEKFSKVMKKRRIIGVLFATAIVSFLLDSSWSWLPSTIVLLVSAAGLVFCILLITFAYGHIYFILRACKRRIVSSNKDRELANKAKYKYSVLTTVYIVVALFLCLLPYFCRNLIRSFAGYSREVFIADHVSVVIVYLNSLINPGLYFWRKAEIRKAAVNVLLSLFYNEQ